jgi:hypothetical protein
MTARSRRLCGIAIAALATVATPRCAYKKNYLPRDQDHPHATILLYRRVADNVCEAKLSPYRFPEYAGQTVRWLVINQCNEAHDIQIPYDSFKPHDPTKEKDPTDRNAPEQTKELKVTVASGRSDTITAKLKDSKVDTTYDYQVVVSDIAKVLDPEIVIWP